MEFLEEIEPINRENVELNHVDEEFQMFVPLSYPLTKRRYTRKCIRIGCDELQRKRKINQNDGSPKKKNNN